MSTDKISVIVPTFGRSAELSRALDSIASQTYKNYEVIIVDDNGQGTSNQTANEELIKEYLSLIPQLNYVSLKYNSGASIARNVGLRAATGEYITFLDDDDEFYPQKLEKQIQFIKIQFPNDEGFINCQMDVFRAGIHVRRIKTSYDPNDLLFSALAEKILGTPSLLIPSKLISAVNGFTDRSKGQEWDLTVKLISSGAKFMHQPVPLVKVNITPNSITTTKDFIKHLRGVRGIYRTQRRYFCNLNRRQISTIKHLYLLKLSDAYFHQNFRRSMKFLLMALKYERFSKHLFRHCAKLVYLQMRG